jgi:hypothetical protein
MTQNDKDTIAKVNKLLRDEKYINDFDASILSVENKWCSDFGCSRHPLSGMCLIAAVLFLNHSKHPQDFRVFNQYDIPFEKVNRRGEQVTWKGSHYWLKNPSNNQIIDLTVKQFDDCFNVREGRKGFHQYDEGKLIVPVWHDGQLKGVYMNCRPELPSGQLHYEVSRLGYALAV